MTTKEELVEEVAKILYGHDTSNYEVCKRDAYQIVKLVQSTPRIWWDSKSPWE